jgi:hypothetical protein
VTVSRKDPCPLYSSTIILCHNIPKFHFHIHPLPQPPDFDTPFFHSSPRSVLCLSPVFSRVSPPGPHVSTCAPPYPPPFCFCSTIPLLENHALNFQPSTSTSKSRYFVDFAPFDISLARVVPRSQCPSIVISLPRDLTGPKASISTLPWPSTKNMSFGRNGSDPIRRLWYESSLDRDHDAEHRLAGS